jgi:hypothetical protein
MNRADHHQEAERLLSKAPEEQDSVRRSLILAEAQVHATLALSAPAGKGPAGPGQDRVADTKSTGAAQSGIPEGGHLDVARPAGIYPSVPGGFPGPASPESRPGPLPMREEELNLPTTLPVAQPPPLGTGPPGPSPDPRKRQHRQATWLLEAAGPAGERTAPDDSGEEGPDDAGEQKPGGPEKPEPGDGFTLLQQATGDVIGPSAAPRLAPRTPLPCCRTADLCMTALYAQEACEQPCTTAESPRGDPRLPRRHTRRGDPLRVGPAAHRPRAQRPGGHAAAAAASSLAAIGDGEPGNGAMCMGPGCFQRDTRKYGPRQLPLCSACRAALEGRTYQREIPPSAARAVRRGAA